MILAGINETRPPRRLTIARQEVGMVETRVGLQAAMGGDRTKTAHPATPVSVEELAQPLRDRGDAVVRGHTSDQTDQESRSEGTEPRVDYSYWTE